MMRPSKMPRIHRRALDGLGGDTKPRSCRPPRKRHHTATPAVALGDEEVRIRAHPRQMTVVRPNQAEHPRSVWPA